MHRWFAVPLVLSLLCAAVPAETGDPPASSFGGLTFGVGRTRGPECAILWRVDAPPSLEPCREGGPVHCLSESPHVRTAPRP